MTDSQDELGEAREEEARTDAMADSHDEVEPAAEEAQQTGYLDAEPPPETDDKEASEPEGTGYVDAEGQVEGKDYPVAHVIDLKAETLGVTAGRMTMCGEEIEGDLLGNRVLAYTCTACQDALTAQKNVLADALLEAQLRLRIITQTSIGGSRIKPLSTEWTRRVREVAADAQDAILDQLDSGPRNER